MNVDILYAQSGGVTAVINATAAGLFLKAKTKKIHGYYAGIHGILGVLDEHFVNLSYEREAELRRLVYQPGGAFGSCRYKLPELGQRITPDPYARLMEVFEAHRIGYLIYNGGGDSADTCHKVASYAKRSGYPIKTLHIPKTIDNDLPHTHFSPGFGSVARYTALCTLETAMDLASMCATSTKVFVLEVMGRHTGWIAAAAGMASRQSHSLPLIILVPEVPFDEERFCAGVEDRVTRFGYCSVIVSEGVRDADGNFLAQSQSMDAFGHAQLGGSADVVNSLISSRLKLKVHRAISDYLQRAAAHAASKVDRQVAFEVGEVAVEWALQGRSEVMIGIHRDEQSGRWQYHPVPLADVANAEKPLPQAFLDDSKMGISEACRDYMAPFMQPDHQVPTSADGLPRYAQLKMTSVAKRLANAWGAR